MIIILQALVALVHEKLEMAGKKSQGSRTYQRLLLPDYKGKDNAKLVFSCQCQAKVSKGCKWAKVTNSGRMLSTPVMQITDKVQNIRLCQQTSWISSGPALMRSSVAMRHPKLKKYQINKIWIFMVPIMVFGSRKNWSQWEQSENRRRAQP